MKCPNCGYTDSRVLDSRPQDDFLSIRRRRECFSCRQRFTTYERVEEAPVSVKKRDGSIEVFDRAKILRGVMRACEKRPVEMSDLESLVSQIETDLAAGSVREISSRDVGELVMEKLWRIDEVAYVRFASVYRRFSDLNAFLEELQQILSQHSGGEA